MTNERNLDILRRRLQRIEQVNREATPSEGMPIEVVGEAIDHLLRNYDEMSPDVADRCKEDFVFIIGRGHYGVDRGSSDTFDIDETMLLGDAHTCSHAIADIMASDRHFEQMFLHAFHVYARQRDQRERPFG